MFTVLLMLLSSRGEDKNQTKIQLHWKVKTREDFTLGNFAFIFADHFHIMASRFPILFVAMVTVYMITKVNGSRVAELGPAPQPTRVSTNYGKITLDLPVSLTLLVCIYLLVVSG